MLQLVSIQFQNNTFQTTIKSQLFGQDHAVDQLCDAVWLSQSGLRENNKTMGSFLLTGPSGVGKTQVAQLLAENLGYSFVKFDMSEFQEKFSVSSLIGAPPGYVGFEDGNVGGGKLISDLSKHPFSVILFDEIEKAHSDVTNILLQMLDEGHVTGANGKRADCKNTIIIMTSNLGARDNENNNIGFSTELEKSGEEDRAMKEFFRPELRNRIDRICKFTKLDTLAIKKIVVKFLDQLKSSVSEKNIKLFFSEPVIDLLAEKGYDSKMGARPLNRKIDELIRVPLGKKILFDRLEDCTVSVVAVDGNIDFVIEQEPRTQPTVDSNGYIILD